MLKKVKDNIFYLCLFCLVAYIFVWKILQSYISEDTFFLLSTGREILNNGIIHENPFFVLPGYQLVVQQWLYDVILYGAYAVFGNMGLFITVLCCTLFCMVMIFKVAKEFNVDSVIAGVAIFIFMFINIGAISTRPTILTVGLLFAQILYCEKFKKSYAIYETQRCKTEYKFIKYLAYIILISILEVNVHACLWPMHLILILPYICPEIRNPVVTFWSFKYHNNSLIGFADKERNMIFLATAMAMFCCGAINPYGFYGWGSVVQTNINELVSVGIIELQPIPLLHIWTLTLMIAVCFVVTYRRRLDGVCCEHIYIFAGLSILGCLFPRNIIYGTMGITIIAFCFLRDTEFGTFHNFVNRQSKKVYAVMGVMFCIATVILSKDGIWQIEDSSLTPVKAIQYLDENAHKGDKVCTMFNGGSYLEWNGYKIYLEGRTEGYFEKINQREDIMTEYINLIKGFSKEEYDKFLEKYEFDYIITDDSASVFRVMVELDNNMSLVVHGNKYQMYKVD